MKTRAVNNVSSYLLDINVEDDAWLKALPDYEIIIDKSLHAAFSHIKQLETLAQTIEISINLTNDADIKRLNLQYRGKDKPTNVLSFPQIDWNIPGWKSDPVLMLGDIVIALETIERESAEQNKTLKNHFIHMLIHSFVHLCGFDHENEQDAKEMETLEIGILKNLGIKNPYQII